MISWPKISIYFCIFLKTAYKHNVSIKNYGQKNSIKLSQRPLTCQIGANPKNQVLPITKILIHSLHREVFLITLKQICKVCFTKHRKHSLVDSTADFEFEDPVQSHLEPNLFAPSKIDENFCLGVILCEKHDGDIIFSWKFL